MRTELYRVETTFLGADAPSKFYFDEAIKAEEFLEKECSNGFYEPVGIISDYRLNYSDGCTWDDLTYGQNHKPKEIILAPSGWYYTKALGDVFVDEYNKVVRANHNGVTVYPYRKVKDGWNECAGEYTMAYLARLMREGKAKWN